MLELDKVTKFSLNLSSLNQSIKSYLDIYSSYPGDRPMLILFGRLQYSTSPAIDREPTIAPST